MKGTGLIMSLIGLVAGLGCSIAPAADAPRRPTGVRIDWSAGPALPTGTAGHVAVRVDDELLVAGGTNWEGETKQWLRSIWSLRPGESAWRTRADLARPLGYGVAFSWKDRMIVAGGTTQDDPCLQTLEFPGADKALPDLPKPRVFSAAGQAGESLYLAGGSLSPSDFSQATTSLLTLSLDAAEPAWRERAPMPTPARSIAAGAVCGGRLYVFGGMASQSSGGFVNLAELLCYDPATDRWTRGADLPVPARGMAACALDERRILVAGGCTSDGGQTRFLNDVWVYDTIDDTYTSATPLPLAAMGMQAIRVGGQVWLIGGEDQPRHRSSHVWVGHVHSLGRATETTGNDRER